MYMCMRESLKSAVCIICTVFCFLPTKAPPKWLGGRFVAGGGGSALQQPARLCPSALFVASAWPTELVSRHVGG